MKNIISKLNLPVRIATIVVLFLIGLALLTLSQVKPYTLWVNGNQINIRAIAFTPRQLFEWAEIDLQDEDFLTIDPDRFSLNLPSQIELNQARSVLIKTPDGDKISFSAELFPANLLAEVGISLYPQDLIKLDGQITDFDQPLSPGLDVIIEYLPAKRIDVYSDGEMLTTIFTQAETFRDAIVGSGLSVHDLDEFDPPLETILNAENRLELIKARQVCVYYKDGNVCGLTPAKTTAFALADLGITLQHLDYTQSSEGSSIPQDGIINLTRVSERLSLVTDETTFSYSYQPDPEAELDTTSVIEPGHPGITVSRTIERIEDGNVISAVTEPEWQASQSTDGILGYGMQVTVKTESVDGQELEYWRKVSVYATSYHPAEFDGSTATRSGLPLTKGIVAVSAAWYPNMAMQSVYIPGYGYGTIADSGYGIPGRYWIDLGYDDDNYVGWHHWTTLYFLTPVPASYPGVLP